MRVITLKKFWDVIRVGCFWKVFKLELIFIFRYLDGIVGIYFVLRM